MNSFGSSYRISIYGESHGAGVGVVLDGVIPGIPLSEEDFFLDLARRKPGAKGTTPRIEKDIPEILSGVHEGHTTGAPINIFFRNSNTESRVYKDFKSHPRPGHADYSATQKYWGYNDIRGSGHFSGRMTLALVAAGVVAKKLINRIAERDGQDLPHYSVQLEKIGKFNLLGEPERENIINYEIERVAALGDSLGGVIGCKVKNLPPALGEPFFDSVESLFSHLLFSIPGIKGVEFGSGFGGCEELGSFFNDRFISAEGETESNNNGGVNGGITNGNDLSFRVAVKPTSSIFVPQETFNFATGEMETLKIQGRHDAAFVLRVPVIVESVSAIVLADLFLRKNLRCSGSN
ncbi:MAG: chorismate synthase [Fusobacteriaceae bacterium]